MDLIILNDFFLLNLNDLTLKKLKYPEGQKINYVVLANYLYLNKKIPQFISYQKLMKMIILIFI